MGGALRLRADQPQGWEPLTPYPALPGCLPATGAPNDSPRKADYSATPMLRVSGLGRYTGRATTRLLPSDAFMSE